MEVDFLSRFSMDRMRRVKVNFVLELWPLAGLLPAEKRNLSFYCLQVSKTRGFAFVFSSPKEGRFSFPFS